MASEESVPRGEWPLVGREVELGWIAAALADPACPSVVIAAPAGTGKSRLAREACAAGVAAGVQTRWVQATASSATIPLGALHGVISDQIRADDPLELLRRSAAALQGLSDGGRVMLAVDDAQLLDPASAALVLGLAFTPHVFVLATVRSGEPTPDAIDALWKDAGGRRMELSRIDDEALAEFVEAGLDGPCGPATMWRILDACAGNPLYARELVLGAVEEGRLVRRRGVWQLDGWPAITPSLTALITRRTSTLDPERRRPLELLALGEPLRIDELAGLSSYEAMEGCEVRGLIVVEGLGADALVRLAHPLYGEVIRSELPVLRGRALRLALAEAIRRRDPLEPDDALRAARWLLDAGAELPSELLLDAAEAANLAGDPALAESLVSRAASDDASLRAVLLLARAHMLRNRFDQAEEILARSEGAAAAAAARGDPTATAYVSQRVYVLSSGLRRSGPAGDLLRRATDWSDDPGWSALLPPWSADVPSADGSPATLERIRDQLRRPGLSVEAVHSLTRLEAIALAAGGQLREAAGIARRLRPRPPLRDEVDTYDLGVVYYVGEAAGEDWPGLCEYMREVLREGVRIADHHAAGFAASFLGELAIHGGRYREAERWLAEAESRFADHDAFATLSCVHGLRAGVACMTGEPADAQKAVERMRRHMLERPPRSPQMISLACGEGWAARARGDAAGVEEFSRQAAATSDSNVRARLLHEALRAGARPATVAFELERLAGDTDSALIEAFAAHATAAARRDGAALLDAADRLAAIGCVAAAVDAAATAARTFLGEGRQASARRAAARMHQLHPSGEGWDAPVIDGLDGVASGLTPRETQIAALAARGLSNQQIADEMVLSVRTVETYVYRAMQKRNVDNRRDL